MAQNTSPLRPGPGIEPAEDLQPPYSVAFGDVYPRQPSPPFAFQPAREYALDTLKLFISRLEFRRTGGKSSGNKPIAFRVPIGDVREWRDDATTTSDNGYPTIGFVPGRAANEPYGLGPARELEETRDQFEPGTVLVLRGDHVETIQIEISCVSPSERSAVFEGLLACFRLQQDSSALKLVCADYFCRVATFSLMSSEVFEDDDALINRRRAQIGIELTIEEVSLVRYRELVPTFQFGLEAPLP